MTEVFFWGDGAAADAMRVSLPDGRGLCFLPPEESGLEELPAAGEFMLICPRLDDARRNRLLDRLKGVAALVLEADPEIEAPRADRGDGWTHVLLPPELLATCLPALLAAMPARTPMSEAEQDRAAEYLRGILTVAGAFRVAADVEAIFDKITDQLIAHFPFRRAMLFLWKDGRLVPRAVSWPRGRADELLAALEAEPPVLEPDSPEQENLALGISTPVDLEFSSFFSPEVKKLLAPAAEAALAPLFTDQEFLGVVTADMADEQTPLTRTEMALLDAYVTLAGSLVFNSWLFAELEENNRDLALKVNQLTVINDMTRILNQGRDPGEAADEMLASAARVLGADMGFLFIYDEETKTLRLFGDYGLDPETAARWERLGGIDPHAIQSISPRRHRRMASGRQLPSELLPGLEGPCMVHFLRSGDRVVGIWGLGRGRGGAPFRSDDEQVLLTADDHVMVAINSLRLRHLANTDPLTGLFTRRHFQEALDQEMRMSHRRGVDLALLMADADHFKYVNDAHGHPAGDAVLAALGQGFRACTRQLDVCARIGGEEFAVILPHCNAQSAFVVAEKIRKYIASRPVRYQGHTIHFTISLGAAVQPAGTELDRDELIRRADRALYQSKNTGRNKTTMFEEDA